MTYTKNPTWVDGLDGTLITAAKLNHIEDGIESASNAGRVQFVTLSSASQSIALPSAVQGDVVTLIVTADGGTPDWDSDIIWESFVEPTLSTTAGQRDVLTFLYTGDDWLGFVSGVFGPPPDTTGPTAGTLGVVVGATTADLTVTGASDNLELHATAPYAFSDDDGTTWTAWQASATYQFTSLTPGTSYTFKHKVRDAAENETIGTAVTTSTSNSLVASYVGTLDNSTAQSTYTFSNANIGTESSDRTVIVAIHGRSVSNQTISSVTIGGTTATIDFQETLATSTTYSLVGFARLAVPSGTTANIVVNVSSSIAALRAVVYRVTGGTPSFVDADGAVQYTTQGAAVSFASIDTEDDGIAIGIVLGAVDNPSYVWTNLTKRSEVNVGTSPTALTSAADTTSAGTLTISADPTLSTYSSGAVISYGVS